MADGDQRCSSHTLHVPADGYENHCKVSSLANWADITSKIFINLLVHSEVPAIFSMRSSNHPGGVQGEGQLEVIKFEFQNYILSSPSDYSSN